MQVGSRRLLGIIGFVVVTVILINPVFINAFAAGPPYDWAAHPPIHIKKAATTSPTGLFPAQIRHAYGFDQLTCSFTGTFGSSTLCGYGQTIAIVDAFDDPNIENDLGVFSSEFGLPSCTTANGCFVKATPQGLPRTDQGWALEISLDVEWVHAIAPGAKILLVEAKSNSFSSLLGAVDYAASQSGVHQVSMSWGGSEFSSEASYDGHFQVSGVSFSASSGDSGTGIIWPAVSPYVVGVGGTTLNVDSLGNVQGETAWSGSGGGVSAYESIPTYQNGFNQYAGRGVPDVSYDADPNTGVPVLDTFGYQGSSGWFQVGGTSVGAPQWAAALAIANGGGAALSSQSFGTETSLYKAAGGTSYNLNNIYYRDITSGSNGACGSICTAAPGYDFVTGLGSPLSNNLIPYLQPSSTPTFTVSSSASSLTISAGGSAQSQITVASTNGFTGTVNLVASTSSTAISASLSSSLVSLTSTTTSATTLTVSAASTTAAGSYSVTVTGTSGTLSSSTSVAVTVQTVPSAPQNLVATPGNAQVTLSWSAPASNGGSAITNYNVYRGTSSGGEAFLAPAGNVLTYTDTAVTNGNTYYYQVTAVNIVGESARSNQASAAPSASITQPSLTVSVNTDKTSYTLNSWVYITVKVKDSSTNLGVAGATVTVTVKDPNGATATGSGVTDSTGSAYFKYKVMPNGLTGTYTVNANASATGYNPGSASPSSFTVS